MELFRRYKLLLPLVICLVITIGMGVFLLVPDREARETETESKSETDTGAPTETEQGDLTVEPPVFHSDLFAYETYMNAPAGSHLLLVNKSHLLASDYVPEDRIPVADARKDITLCRTAEKALEAMFIEMRTCGYRGVFVTSAYRSYAYQNGLFQTYIGEEMSKNPSLSETEAREKVLRYSARPGTSEHQTGLCVDLMIDGMRDLDESFATYPVYEWLQENAWKFGFVLRFPADKTEITGYDFEPWHYRFVGREDAYRMYKTGMCLEEYVASLE